MVMPETFPDITKDQLEEIDYLAKLMQKPDENFEELIKIWQTKKELRRLKGLLLYET
ncbi:hypothetical protein HY008_00240 [Candidatus Woesebacteria bacterium]|nr:hypothetical protein [Candidatus Woesebacteria bacterium]